MRRNLILNGEMSGAVFAPDDVATASPAAPAVSPSPASAPQSTEISPSPPASPAVEAPAPATSLAPADVPTTDGAGQPKETPATEPAKTESKEFPPTLAESAEKPAAAKPEAKPGDKPEAEKAPDGKAPAEAQGENPAPPTYAFQWPEGFNADQLDKERMAAFTGWLGENHVPQEHAQKLLDMHVQEVQAIADRVTKHVADAQWDVFRTQQNAWKDEVLADPVLGGSRHQTAMRTINTLVEQYGGTPDERKALWDDLRATGAGNSPRILRFMHRLGEVVGREATMVPATPGRTASLSPRDRGLARYQGSSR